MYLNSCSCLEVFNAYKSKGVKQNEIYRVIFDAIVPNHGMEYNPSNIKTGKADIPTPIRAALRKTDSRPQQVVNFKSKVTPLIEDNLKLIICSFLVFLEKDKTIADYTTIAGRRKSEWKMYTGTIHPESFLVEIIAFSCLRGHLQPDNGEYLKDSFLRKVKSKAKGIYLQEDAFTSYHDETVKLEANNFRATFREVPLPNNLKNVNLHLFLLEHDACRFLYHGLITYLRENLYTHIHTRNEIIGYNNEGAQASMFLDARTKLNEKYIDNHGNILDTLLVESFVTEVTNARKIINILEHDSSGIPSGSHGIHFIQRKTKNGIDYQAIIAIASLRETNIEAISNAFKDISCVINSTTDWRNSIFSQHSLLSKMPRQEAELISNIFIRKSINQKVPPTGYGIFLGYSENDIKPLNSIEEEIATKIFSIVSHIESYISELKLESSELNIYIMPFNNVISDKEEILKGVLS